MHRANPQAASAPLPNPPHCRHNTAMNYQVTCVCGHAFVVGDDKVGKHTACPACQRALIPVASTPAEATTVAASPDATKRCPYCGEVILAIAKKCKHCGEYLDRSAAPATITSPNAAPEAEKPPVFSLTVSQWDNFFRYIVCLTLVLIVAAVFLLIPTLKPIAPTAIFGTLALMGFMAYFFFLSARTSRCHIRPTRIETETGIFSKQIDSLELYRITDLELDQGLIQRLLRIGTVKIRSNDPSNPELVLYQIPQARAVYKYLQEQVPLAQKARGSVFLDR